MAESMKREAQLLAAGQFTEDVANIMSVLVIVSFVFLVLLIASCVKGPLEKKAYFATLISFGILLAIILLIMAIVEFF